MKVRHYAAKTPVAPFYTNWDAILVELLVGLISVVMAYGGFQAGLLLMAVPLSLVAFVSILMAIHTVVMGIIEKRQRINALEREIKENSVNNLQ